MQIPSDGLQQLLQDPVPALKHHQQSTSQIRIPLQDGLSTQQPRKSMVQLLPWRQLNPSPHLPQKWHLDLQRFLERTRDLSHQRPLQILARFQRRKYTLKRLAHQITVLNLLDSSLGTEIKRTFLRVQPPIPRLRHLFHVSKHRVNPEADPETSLDIKNNGCAADQRELKN